MCKAGLPSTDETNTRLQSSEICEIGFLVNVRLLWRARAHALLLIYWKY